MLQADVNRAAIALINKYGLASIPDSTTWSLEWSAAYHRLCLKTGLKYTSSPNYVIQSIQGKELLKQGFALLNSAPTQRIKLDPKRGPGKDFEDCKPTLEEQLNVTVEERNLDALPASSEEAASLAGVKRNDDNYDFEDDEDEDGDGSEMENNDGEGDDDADDLASDLTRNVKRR